MRASRHPPSRQARQRCRIPNPPRYKVLGRLKGNDHGIIKDRAGIIKDSDNGEIFVMDFKFAACLKSVFSFDVVPDDHTIGIPRIEEAARFQLHRVKGQHWTFQEGLLGFVFLSCPSCPHQRWSSKARRHLLPRLPTHIAYLIVLEPSSKDPAFSKNPDLVAGHTHGTLKSLVEILRHGAHNYNCKNPEGYPADCQCAPDFPVRYISDDQVKHNNPA